MLFSNLMAAQIKIGDAPEAIDPSSILELESSSKVLVISRMTEADILALSPLQGAMVYNIDASCIFYYDGANWNNLCAGSAETITWGSITGTIADQPDLIAEFQNYVNLTTAQSIAGEKTLTEKFTVNTGSTTDQIAEFLGRVKGEDGTAPEDFVTKAQLDAFSGGGTWGSISGTLTDQTDLAAEFQNYVDLLNTQTIGGEKTLTDKLTVNTGTTADQVAEFLGRVKGEDGTAPEDFVTKAQLDAASGTVTGTEGSIFFADASTQPTEDNANLFWDNTSNQLRVGDSPSDTGSNNSTVNIQGSVSKTINFGQTGLNETHHTTIIDVNATVFLPNPATCVGRIYIIKKRPGATITIQGGYLDTNSDPTTIMDGGVLQLQSNGFLWDQIN